MNKTAYLYVDEHLISPSLICPICLEILQEPHTHITCDSAFCRSCLSQLVEPVCPICRWIWDDSIPLQDNIYLPKSSRLIRNMLDDLLVQCIHCQTVRRRGQFEHECQPNEQVLIRKPTELIPKANTGNIRMILSSLIIFFFLLFIYYCRNYVFEKGINRQNELINEIAYNLDYYLLEKIYYLTMKIIEYSMTIFLLNICFWFSIKFYGDRMTSKTNIRILKNFFEISIIINLITYSLYN
jgi:hypothetical protein